VEAGDGVRSGIWRSLGSWVLRRPVREPDETPFPYFAALRTNYAIFIGLSAIEIPALHFLIPWPVARTVLVVLSIWGFLWCLGMLASIARHPHVISKEALRLRFGSTVNVPMPWAAIGSLAPERRFPAERRTVQVLDAPTGAALQIAIANQTNLCVKLREPTTIGLPSGSHTITTAWFYADDPAALLAAAQEHLSHVDRKPPTGPPSGRESPHG
jgi:hypothetical protein